jgi:hypothetical protein
MTDINTRGATPDEWFHFDFVLGLGGNLLPCVPAGEDVRVLAGSALEGKVGKIPSQFNRQGEAHGLVEWQKREILSNELQIWSADPRLNICVRTGPISGVYALDVDVDDPTLSPEIGDLLYTAFSEGNTRPMVYRGRTGPSRKFLIPFRMDTPCKKRKIKLDNTARGPAIELLADGQQFVAAGSHSSGARYQWQPGLPQTLPTISMDQLNQIWATLTRTYATPESQKANQIAQGGEATTTPTPTSSPATGSPSVDTSTWSCLTTITDSDWDQLISALRFLLDKVADNDTWSEVGYALLSIQATRPAEALWKDFSRKAVGYEEGAAEIWWGNHFRQTPRTDYRHIFKMARDRGLARVADVSAFTPVVETGSAEGGEEQPVPGPGAGTGASEDVRVVPDAPTQPIIQLIQGNYSNIIDQMEALMVPEVYVQGPHLTRRSQAHTEAKIRRESDAIMLIKVTKEWMAKRFGEISIVQKWMKSETKWVNDDIAEKYVNGLLNLGGWTRIRPLDAIARSPFVRPDGSICDQPGYDSGTRVLYVPSTEYPDIPANPDQDCAREAIERIRGVFDEFPWKEPASESAFLSHILAEASRLAVDQCPMYFYDAPIAGTGKGLLQEMAARIVHGSEPAIRTWVSDGDEIRKSLYASVLAGDRSLWFDNIPNGSKVRSPELCSFITSPTWKDRKLGESETLGVPNKVVLVGSGNNITPVGDMARRSLVVRMDANTENLKGRTFKIPEGTMRPYVMERRAQMLVDALTVIKAFHAANVIFKPPVALASFGQWSKFCRDPLIWLGLADPVITQKETDDETKHVGNVFETLYEQFADREFGAREVVHLVNGLADPDGELANSLIENGCPEPNSPKKVGYWLRECRDRIGRGLKLVHAGEDRKGMRWKFVRMDLT